MTAVELLAELRAARCHVRAQGPRLAVAGTVPPALQGPLSVLHVAMRGLVTGLPIYGYARDNGRVRLLNPAKLVPSGFDRFAVAGDLTWDLLPCGTEQGQPDLFTARSREDGRLGGKSRVKS